MRGFGDDQRASMKRVDPRIGQLFHRLREMVDILEQVMLYPYFSPAQDQSLQPKVDKPPVATPTLGPVKLAYTIKEVRQLVGISRAKLYQAMQDRKLRAVKCDHRTLILAKDLQAWIDGWPESRG